MGYDDGMRSLHYSHCALPQKRSGKIHSTIAKQKKKGKKKEKKKQSPKKGIGFELKGGVIILLQVGPPTGARKIKFISPACPGFVTAKALPSLLPAAFPGYADWMPFSGGVPVSSMPTTSALWPTRPEQRSKLVVVRV